MNALSEPGLYELICFSNKPQAKIFRKWVFKEVLPAIRQTGQYSINPFQNQMAQLETESKRLENLKAQLEAESIRIENLKKEESLLKEKHDRLADAKDIFTESNDDRAVVMCLDGIKNLIMANQVVNSNNLLQVKQEPINDEQMLSLSEYVFKTWGIQTKTSTWVRNMQLPDGRFGRLASYIKRQYHAHNRDESPNKATKYVNGHRVLAGPNNKGKQTGVAIYSMDDYEEFIHDILAKYLTELQK